MQGAFIGVYIPELRMDDGYEYDRGFSIENLGAVLYQFAVQGVKYRNAMSKPASFYDILVDGSSESHKVTVAPIDVPGNITCVNEFLTVQNDGGRGRGVARLCRDPKDGNFKAYTLFTALYGLSGLKKQPEPGDRSVHIMVTKRTERIGKIGERLRRTSTTAFNEPWLSMVRAPSISRTPSGAYSGSAKSKLG